jgi:anti-sigma regulatory factor (Ser/Thr protein kinase)
LRWRNTTYASLVEQKASDERGGRVVRFARQWFSAEELTDVEFAVGEALANSVEHGANDAEVIDVRDRGRGFSRWKTSKLPPPPVAMRGYGIYIMCALMDELEYSERGRHLHLAKKSRTRSYSSELLA